MPDNNPPQMPLSEAADNFFGMMTKEQAQRFNILLDRQTSGTLHPKLEPEYNNLRQIMLTVLEEKRAILEPQIELDKDSKKQYKELTETVANIKNEEELKDDIENLKSLSTPSAAQGIELSIFEKRYARVTVAKRQQEELSEKAYREIIKPIEPEATGNAEEDARAKRKFKADMEKYNKEVRVQKTALRDLEELEITNAEREKGKKEKSEALLKQDEKIAYRAAQQKNDPVQKAPEDAQFIQASVADILNTPVSSSGSNEVIRSFLKEEGHTTTTLTKEEKEEAKRKLEKLTADLPAEYEKLSLHLAVYGGDALSSEDKKFHSNRSRDLKFLGLLANATTEGFTFTSEIRRYKAIDDYMDSNAVKEKNKALNPIKSELLKLMEAKYRLEHPRKKHELPSGLEFEKLKKDPEKSGKKLEKKLAKERTPKVSTLSRETQAKLNELILEHERQSKEYDEDFKKRLEAKIGPENIKVYERLNLFEQFFEKVKTTDPGLFSQEELDFYHELIQDIRNASVNELSKLQFELLKDMKGLSIQAAFRSVEKLYQDPHVLWEMQQKAKYRLQELEFGTANTTTSAAENTSQDKVKAKPTAHSIFLTDASKLQKAEASSSTAGPSAPPLSRIQKVKRAASSFNLTGNAASKDPGSQKEAVSQKEPASLLKESKRPILRRMSSAISFNKKPAETDNNSNKTDDNNNPKKPSPLGKKP